MVAMVLLSPHARKALNRRQCRLCLSRNQRAEHGHRTWLQFVRLLEGGIFTFGWRVAVGLNCGVEQTFPRLGLRIGDRRQREWDLHLMIGVEKDQQMVTDNWRAIIINIHM